MSTFDVAGWRGAGAVVVAEIPSTPWRWRHLRHREQQPGTWSPGQLAELLATVRREEAEAAEECRAALERALSPVRDKELWRIVAGLKRVRGNDREDVHWLDLPIKDLEALCAP